jgi:hypothetical protein
MALHLSQRKLVGVEAIRKEDVSPFMFPKASTIRFDFAPYGNMPALKVFWYDGMKETPKIEGVPEGEWLGDPPFLVRANAAGGPGGGSGRRGPGGSGASGPPNYEFRSPGRVYNHEQFMAMKAAPKEQLRFPTPDGSLFIGDKGMLTTGTYGDVTRLIPIEKMKDYRMPAPTLTRSPGHMLDFIRACKGGDAACSNFDVAAPFVEWMLLGVIALRHEGKLEYDPEKMRIVNNKEATNLLKPTFRKGWEFHTVRT